MNNKLVIFSIIFQAFISVIIAGGQKSKLDTSCLLEINGTITTLGVNESYSDYRSPCQIVTCYLNDFDLPKINYTEIHCNHTCEEGSLLKREPHECCGTCSKNFCRFNNASYMENEIWKDKDNCTVHECKSDNDGELFVLSYKKQCPELGDCDPNDIITRDCCRFCTSTRQRRVMTLSEQEQLDFTDINTYIFHPCLRDCKVGESLTCYYEFNVEEYETMSKACYDCPFNTTDCFRPHCIAADGFRRSLLVINRMMPGPAIEVCKGDTVIVDVRNRLMSDSTTIHWHGLHMKKTPYMDGVPHIAQCPIIPGHTFRYTFEAENEGTHFWHSHIGMQRGDGSFGALIVRVPRTVDPHSSLYDFDMSDHMVIIQDWTHLPGVSVFTAHHHGRADNKPPNILINGKGKYFGNRTQTEPIVSSSSNRLSEALRVSTTAATEFSSSNPETNSGEAYSDEIEEFDDNLSTTLNTLYDDDVTTSEVPQESTENIPVPRRNQFKNIAVLRSQRTKRAIDPPTEESPMMPYEMFLVDRGSRYRFRIINAEFLNCPVEISIDNHNFSVIASDGYDFQAVEVSSLVSYAGERFDIVVKANQPVGNYWVRVRGLMDCDERFTSAYQVAILRYRGASLEDPTPTPQYNYTIGAGIQLNALNKGSGEEKSLSVAELNSVGDPIASAFRREPDFKFFVYYDFYPKNNPLFHDANLYGFQQVRPENGRVFTPQLNHISLQLPDKPLMPAKDQFNDSMFCNEESLISQGINCREEFCTCSHVLKVPLNSLVEVILVDEGVAYDANHPFHLHGMPFRVVGMERLNANVTIESVKELDRIGRLRRKLVDPPLKDTVTIPDGGYTIIRFLADNPGYWLFHCHIEFHAEIGMALIFKIGEHNQMQSAPPNFPTCGNYVPTSQSESIIQPPTGSSSRLLINTLILLPLMTFLFFIL